ncbi:MAG: S41 family peptidase, partial [Myxococcota bacterium]
MLPGRRAIPTHLAAFAAGAIFATAVLAHAIPSASSKNSRRYRSLDTFAQALSYITNSYVDRIDERKLMYGAVRGMVDRLDEHSAFYSPNRYRRLRQDTAGEFGGVGVTLDSSINAQGKLAPIIDTIIANSPAARAGLAEGDQIVAVDGKPTASDDTDGSIERWRSRLRGLAGSRVTLSVMRPSWSAAREYTLLREQVKVPTVEWLAVESGIGYIAIKKFQEATTTDVRAALTVLAQDPLDVVILDLRGNPGGILEQSVQVADLFLDRGVIVTIRGRRGTRVERELAHRSGTWSNVRLLVLIDRGSASAAEIVAGALQDNKRAVIMGLPSFGKGSIQTFIDLDDGSGLKLTTARFYTPAGRTLEGAGITPDHHVEAFAEEVVVA